MAIVSNVEMNIFAHVSPFFSPPTPFLLFKFLEVKWLHQRNCAGMW